ncbi:ParB N-terminal domain-containing protein [Shewanella woodyi]|uniref:ParB N-terminal domain-containing protein n=1 Tax=Shewanella woodyi TaxID=60961 RepID=UPI003748BCAE
MAGNIDMWWEKRALRSIDQLKLWQDNPRLDPAESHITLADFTEELISIPSDKQSFMELISSIADKGYLSFDPIVVWKDEQDRYVVAEGNRRVLAMKLLRNPSKSPRSIRKFVMQQAELIERDSIDKVRVCVAPSFEDCEWYILQRHSTSTIQRRWERLQQQRWIVSLCDKYSNNLEVIRSKTGFTRSEIEKTLRYVKLRDLSTRNEVVKLMDTQEKEIIYSHRIPMTIIERWFDSADVRDAWGLQYSGSDIKITSNESSFLFAYAKLLKRILNSDKYPDEVVINTRTVPEKNTEILKSLPAVLDSQDVVDPQDTSSEARGGADKPNTNDATKDTEANNVGDKEKTSSDKATEKKKLTETQIEIRW